MWEGACRSGEGVVVRGKGPVGQGGGSSTREGACRSERG